MVCGIAPYGNNVVVLSYDEQDSIQEVRVTDYRVLSIVLITRWHMYICSNDSQVEIKPNTFI